MKFEVTARMGHHVVNPIITLREIRGQQRISFMTSELLEVLNELEEMRTMMSTYRPEALGEARQ